MKGRFAADTTDGCLVQRGVGTKFKAWVSWLRKSAWYPFVAPILSPSSPTMGLHTKLGADMDREAPESCSPKGPHRCLCTCAYVYIYIYCIYIYDICMNAYTYIHTQRPKAMEAYVDASWIPGPEGSQQGSEQKKSPEPVPGVVGSWETLAGPGKGVVMRCMQGRDTAEG